KSASAGAVDARPPPAARASTIVPVASRDLPAFAKAVFMTLASETAISPTSFRRTASPCQRGGAMARTDLDRRIRNLSRLPPDLDKKRVETAALCRCALRGRQASHVSHRTGTGCP